MGNLCEVVTQKDVKTVTKNGGVQGASGSPEDEEEVARWMKMEMKETAWVYRAECFRVFLKLCGWKGCTSWTDSTEAIRNDAHITFRRRCRPFSHCFKGSFRQRIMGLLGLRLDCIDRDPCTFWVSGPLLVSTCTSFLGGCYFEYEHTIRKNRILAF